MSTHQPKLKLSLKKAAILNAISAGFLISGIVGYLLGTKSKTKKPANYKTPLPIQTQEQTDTQSQKCAGGDRYFSINESTKNAWCRVVLPLDSYKVTGYTLLYPNHWSVQLLGAEVMNLNFTEGKNSSKKQNLFIQITTTNLSLEKAYQANYGFELSGPYPLVEPEETIINKTIQPIEERRVLKLITNKNDHLIQRYFILKIEGGHSGLYMFETDGENPKLVKTVEEIISTLKFLK